MTDKQLIRYTRAFRRGILGKRPSNLCCLMVCAPLSTLLGIDGVKNRLVEGRFEGGEHFWLELEDGRVLDPTADQFNDYGHEPLPDVYLGKPTVIHGKRT